MVNLCRNDVALLVTVERSEALEGQIVGFGRATCEDNLFRCCTDEVGNVLTSLFAGLFRFPAVCVRSRVWIAEAHRHEWEHLVEHSATERPC